MLPPLIVADKERSYPLYRLSGRLIILHIDLLILYSPPQPFDKDVVQRPSPPVHTHLDPRCCQSPREVETGELYPLITVENLWVSHLQGSVQCLQTKAHIHRDRHRPRQHIPTAPIHHRYQLNKPAMEPNRRDIRTPNLIHPRDWDPAQQVRVHPMRRMGVTHPWFGIDGLQPHGAQQPRDTFVIHRIPLTP